MLKMWISQFEDDFAYFSSLQYVESFFVLGQRKYFDSQFIVIQILFRHWSQQGQSFGESVRIYIHAYNGLFPSENLRME
jgi:hypothetical protein